MGSSAVRASSSPARRGVVGAYVLVTIWMTHWRRDAYTAGTEGPPLVRGDAPHGRPAPKSRPRKARPTWVDIAVVPAMTLAGTVTL